MNTDNTKLSPLTEIAACFELLQDDVVVQGKPEDRNIFHDVVMVDGQLKYLLDSKHHVYGEVSENDTFQAGILVAFPRFLQIFDEENQTSDHVKEYCVSKGITIEMTNFMGNGIFYPCKDFQWVEKYINFAKSNEAMDREFAQKFMRVVKYYDNVDSFCSLHLLDNACDV